MTETWARVATALPEGSRFHLWRRESGKLMVQVSSTETDPRKFVAAFAGQPDLAEVSAAPGSGGMQLVFTLPVQGEATP